MSLNITGILDGQAGSAQGDKGTTTETFFISLASGFLLFAVQFTVFLFIRIHLWAKRIYQPRSFLVPLKNRIRPPHNNPLKWLYYDVLTIPAQVVLEKQGMDGYFFLRYLTMCLKIFFPMALIILPILIPLNAANGKDSHIIHDVQYNVTGLDRLSWSNISPDNTSRYWAHLVLALIVLVWVCALFHHELLHYIQKRMEYLSSPGHRLKASATSVLITDIPQDLCSVEKLTEYYDDFPGGLRRVWVNRDFRPLVKKVEERNKLEDQLENAETNLIRKCVKKHRKMMQSNTKTSDSTLSVGEESMATNDLEQTRLQSLTARAGSDKRILPPRESNVAASIAEACKSDLQYDLDSKAAWTRYMSPKKRQMTRIPDVNHSTLFHIPLIGRFFTTKIDSIYFCRRALAKLNVEVDQEMASSETYPQIRSAFLQFNTQKAAHLACQGLSHSHPRAMTRRTLELSPGDINWSNLGMQWWQRYLWFGGFIILILISLFLFGVISAFTGILSRVSTLGGSTSWLRWINSLPSWLLSFIQGTLPPVINILILSGPLPIVLRALTNKVQGATTGTIGERSLQLWYFIFLLIELFIVPTISSGLTSTVRAIVNDITSVPNILATDLPTAANYYFSFLIVEALSISASSILQTIRLLNYYVLGSTNTPDSVFQSLTWTNRTRIGSNIPWYTTYAVIGLVYSVIAPLMLVFMLITFGLFHTVIKNNLLYVVRTGNVDGGALFFPEAINQTFTGLYFMELCLIGLFFLVRDANDNVACKAQAIIMIVATILTIFYQWWLYSSLHPLYTYLPVTTNGNAHQKDAEHELQHLRSDENDEEKNGDLQQDRGTSGDTQRSFVNTASDIQNKSPRSLVDTSDATESTAASPGEISALPRANSMRAQQRRDGLSANHILARLNRPLDEARLQGLEQHLATAERTIGNKLLPRRADVEQRMQNDPISQIIMQHNDELEDLEPEERDLLISVAFTHPVLRETRPAVWIPQDEIGVSNDEVARTRDLSADIVIENKGASFDRRLKVTVNKPPPDMSEFALVMAEL